MNASSVFSEYIASYQGMDTDFEHCDLTYAPRSSVESTVPSSSSASSDRADFFF